MTRSRSLANDVSSTSDDILASIVRRFRICRSSKERNQLCPRCPVTAAVASSGSSRLRRSECSTCLKVGESEPTAAGDCEWRARRSNFCLRVSRRQKNMIGLGYWRALTKRSASDVAVISKKTSPAGIRCLKMIERNATLHSKAGKQIMEAGSMPISALRVRLQHLYKGRGEAHKGRNVHDEGKTCYAPRLAPIRVRFFRRPDAVPVPPSLLTESDLGAIASSPPFQDGTRRYEPEKVPPPTDVVRPRSLRARDLSPAAVANGAARAVDPPNSPGSESALITPSLA